MELAEGIRKIGFRRWYERQLIESHLHLVVCIVSMLAALAALEGFRMGAPGWEILLRLAVIPAGGAVSIRSLVRYRVTLEIAMRAAEEGLAPKAFVDAKVAEFEAARNRAEKRLDAALGRGRDQHADLRLSARARAGSPTRLVGHAQRLRDLGPAALPGPPAAPPLDASIAA